MVSVRVLFFLTFCEYMHSDLIFMLYYRSWLSELSWLKFLWALGLSWCAILCWTCVSRMGIWSHQPGGRLCSWGTWSREGMVCLSWSRVWEGLFFCWLYNTMPYPCDALVCGGRRISGIWYCALMGVIKVKWVIWVCSFIKNKGDRCKSELCSLWDGSQLCANK